MIIFTNDVDHPITNQTLVQISWLSIFMFLTILFLFSQCGLIFLTEWNCYNFVTTWFCFCLINRLLRGTLRDGEIKEVSYIIIMSVIILALPVFSEIWALLMIWIMRAETGYSKDLYDVGYSNICDLMLSLKARISLLDFSKNKLSSAVPPPLLFKMVLLSCFIKRVTISKSLFICSWIPILFEFIQRPNLL